MRTTLRKSDAPKFALSRENWTNAKAAIAVATVGLTPGGVRVDAAKLADDETAQLIQLTLGGRNDDRDQKRYEALIEKAAGKQPGSIFRAAREQAQLQREMAELRRETQKPSRRVALAEAGSVTLPRQWIFDFVRDGVLWPAHVGVLAYLLATFENGGLPVESPGTSFDHGVITVSGQRGGLMPDPGGSFLREKDLLDHLEIIGFIQIERHGRTLRISPGSRIENATRRAA